MTDPGGRYVEALGHRIWLQTSGTGRPLLLLNGLGGSLDNWSPLIAELAGRTSIAFDPPGVGSSPAPPFPLSVAAVARIA
jgi:poly(3-hydroxyoctanoate) depolymerase